MKKLRVTNTDLNCSAIILGSVDIGSSLDEKESFRIMDSYVDGGGNMIDTAEVYGNWVPAIDKSISEVTIGKWMKARRNSSNLIVTTKGAHPDINEMQMMRVSKQLIKSDLEGSLKRLQVEAIDLYWLHRDDPSSPVGEIMEALNEHVKSGKVRYFGCSNWQTERIIEAQSYAKEHSLQAFSASQVCWSLALIEPANVADPSLVFMDNNMHNYHRESQLSLFSYSSQARGLFTKLDKGLTDEEVPAIYQVPENRLRYEKVKKLSKELSVSVNQIVLSYLHSQSFPSFSVIGTRTVEQLQDSMGAAQISLTTEQLEFLEG